MTSLRRAFFAILLAVTIIAGAIGAFRWARLRRIESQKAAIPANAKATEFRSVPPFSTKEPERYQATRIITSVESKDASGESLTSISKTLIARDGYKRREEYETGSGEALVYLETSEGRFVLSPGKKLYADLNDSPADSKADAGSVVPTATPNSSPQRLLNEKQALARYEKLGTETINDRAATRYRVTPRDVTSGNNAGSVTLIWIDDALGLPVRSETSSTAGEHPAKLTMELRDLKDTVDARVFELPKDYRKVDYRRFFIESRLTPLVSDYEGGTSAKP